MSKRRANTEGDDLDLALSELRKILESPTTLPHIRVRAAREMMNFYGSARSGSKSSHDEMRAKLLTMYRATGTDGAQPNLGDEPDDDE